MSDQENGTSSSAQQPLDDEKTEAVPALRGRDGESRRTFLKAAVVGGAAVAAAGGVAALRLTGATNSLIRFVGNVNSGDPCDACIEDTGYSVRTYLTTSSPATTAQLNSLGVGFTVNKNGDPQGDFEIFFVDHAAAAATGANKINLTVTVSGKTVAFPSGTSNDIDSSPLVQYQGGGSAVLVTEQTNIASAPCESAQSTTLSTYVTTLAQSSSLSAAGFGTAGGTNYTPVHSTDDVLFQFHMKWNGGQISSTNLGTQVYTFLFQWSDGAITCTKYLYIKGERVD